MFLFRCSRDRSRHKTCARGTNEKSNNSVKQKSVRGKVCVCEKKRLNSSLCMKTGMWMTMIHVLKPKKRNVIISPANRTYEPHLIRHETMIGKFQINNKLTQATVCGGYKGVRLWIPDERVFVYADNMCK